MVTAGDNHATTRDMDFATRIRHRIGQIDAHCFDAVSHALSPEPWASAKELKSLHSLELLEGFIDSVMAPAFARHYAEYGWSIELPCSLQEAVVALAEGKTRLPDAYLQAVFPSFWHAGKGPAARCADPAFWRQVLRYPCGLNDTGEVYPEVTLATMRKSCRVQRKTVSWFSAAKALHVYEEHLDPKKGRVRVWDPSGGFGARMLAAASWSQKHKVSVIYTACEPAEMTFSDLRRLGEGLDRLPGLSFVPGVVNSGSETFPDTGPFDLVFTSPPYFDTERYFDEPGQCWRDYPKREQWEGSYLRPTVETAKAALRPGGKLVLNVKDATKTWEEAVGSGVEVQTFPVKAGPFARARGQSNLNEKLLVWEKP